METKIQFEDHLTLVLRDQDLAISGEQLAMLSKHFNLLQKWQDVHNLTTVRGVDNIVFHHYLDCLLGLSFLPTPKAVFDFGSGAGFPGLIAAVLWPNTSVTLVEASRKKCSFLREASREMGLRNLEIKQLRVEGLKDVQFGISRATFSLSTLQLASKALAINGQMALWLTGPSEKAAEYGRFKLVKKKEFVYQWPGIEPRKVVLLKKAEIV